MAQVHPASARAEPTCAEVEQLLPLVADGALDAEADPVLFAHLAQCDACQQALAHHDMITLAIGQTAAVPAAPRLAVIHFRLPRLVAWASAAALMAGLGGLGWWVRGASQVPAVVADREVIHVTVPGDPKDRGYFLIRDGSKWQRVDPGHLDGAQTPDPAASRATTPVGYHY
jgi:hypothetical protein